MTQTDIPAEVVAKFYLNENVKLQLLGYGLGLFANEVNYCALEHTDRPSSQLDFW